MTSSMTTLVAREHTADLRRAAERGRTFASSSADTRVPAIELRLANAAEAHVVARLAALDDAPELEGQVLLALIDGEAEAGLSLRDGRIVANPFISTHEAVALLRLRAAAATDRGAPSHRAARVLARVGTRVRGRLHQEPRLSY